jgi:hypothetical protein
MLKSGGSFAERDIWYNLLRMIVTLVVICCTKLGCGWNNDVILRVHEDGWYW